MLLLCERRRRRRKKKSEGEGVARLRRRDGGDPLLLMKLKALRQEGRSRRPGMPEVEGKEGGMPRRGSGTGGFVVQRRPGGACKLLRCRSIGNNQPNGCVGNCRCRCGDSIQDHLFPCMK